MTTENLKNPSVPILPDPQDLDLAIQENQIALGNGLSWLEKSFGRARTHPSTVNDDTKRREPKVYQGGSEYYPVLPNDALRSYSFFRVREGREFDDHKNNAYTIFQKAPVDLIVWVNLKEIDPLKDYIFTEELINDVTSILNVSSRVKLMKVWDEKPEDIFKGYTIEANHRDLLEYPFAAFRIEMFLFYPIKCEQP